MTSTEPVRPYGTNGKSACVRVGLSSGPDRPNAGTNRNGFDGDRASARVGPDAAPGTHTVRNEAPAPRVVPVLNGNTDTRGLVSEEEREHLQAFGSDVRAMRKAAGLTQERLGKLAGIGTTHISRLEQGRRRPSVDAIKALARILAPSGTADALEQRWGALAGDSLREGAARKKRRVENKRRKEEAAELMKSTAKVRRLIADKERRGQPVPDILRRLADLDLSARLQPAADEPGITGIEPLRTARDGREEVRDIIRSMARRRR
jgi:transcriptional regulator with XRE-family HTH domain